MREYIWVEEGAVKESGHKLCDPIPFTSDKKPVRLWTLVHFRNQAIVPPANLPLVHRDTAILEDISHDWSIRQGHLIYRGQYAEGGIWLAVEFDS
ncbi:hypothetical protein K08M3_51410 [Vibrio alginolyticus]|uniref:Uncharacterized protein n=1 Tax=Vibrio alginolyticus TaxID=663 RepID=A0A1W6UVE5_VIBAL|nr:hypothetical protein [Vibrio alginolyticus]EHU6485562.1 hypothetical protein [Vibrio parahaemolyticus]ARP06651.1 hypothetical protein K04M1_51280 [Vibrio alginolyticus]ARP11784.1 hypothetical protein K04M3_52150 [Vibrio alginolyticus]ARP16837.1 hypothetical protein K04M5_51850 [Vibrio alginolyticus]ARP21874.1 hypothetical protein K05K4_51720 [Vibrio alginolyticus]